MYDSVLAVLASYADCGCPAERLGRNPARCSGHRPEVEAHAGRHAIEAAVCTCACHNAWARGDASVVPLSKADLDHLDEYWSTF